jgi:hypothetical protein
MATTATESKPKRKFSRVSAYFYLAAMFFLLSVLTLTAFGFNIPLASRLQFVTIAFILLGFGVIFLGATFRITRNLHKAADAQDQKTTGPVVVG